MRSVSSFGRGWSLAVLAFVGGVSPAAAARAHQAPAEPPLFAATECIERVDKRAADSVEIAYHVAVDDTALAQGDIALPDTKSHQFFAFRAGVFPAGFDYAVYPYERDAAPVPLPNWITNADVKRAAQASGSIDATGFTVDDVPDGAVLSEVPALDGLYLRITEDDARVPITQAQAAMGVRFDLRAVPPGLYTLGGYIFSPPFNGWAVRTAPLKVVDADSDVPALSVRSVRGTLFSYQGRRVRGCLDVPEGTTLRADYLIEEHADDGYRPWLREQPVKSGELERCFQMPEGSPSGSVLLRFELQSRGGARFTYYAPDTLTALTAQGECRRAGDVCCDAAPLVGALDAGADCEATGGCGARDGGDDADAAAASDAGAVRSATARPVKDRSAAHHADAGCAAAASLGASERRAHTSALCVLSALLFARRRRGSRSAG